MVWTEGNNGAINVDLAPIESRIANLDMLLENVLSVVQLDTFLDFVIKKTEKEGKIYKFIILVIPTEREGAIQMIEDEGEIRMIEKKEVILVTGIGIGIEIEIETKKIKKLKKVNQEAEVEAEVI